MFKKFLRKVYLNVHPIYKPKTLFIFTAQNSILLDIFSCGLMVISWQCVIATFINKNDYPPVYFSG